MRIVWSGGEVVLEDAWVEDKACASLRTRRTITGEVVVFLPAHKSYKIRVNTCTYQQAMLLKDIALSGETVTVDDEGFSFTGKIKKVDLRHFVRDIKEPAIRQRADIYTGWLEVEAT
ncbi:MAG: hypothetical protein DSY42_07185 [Aquifex sp.]|nr:MAG: hypothetical protein DSY42_07185 [Aquifex sp.]